MRLHEVIDLRERIERRYPKMGPVERRLAHYVLENASEIPFQSITEVAAVLGVHPSTVTRFAQRLGYKGYPALQRVLRGNLREAMAPRVPDEGEVWPRFLELEKEALLALASVPQAEIEAAAGDLARARRVWVLGYRVSRAPAGLLATLMGFLRGEVRLLDEGVLTHPERLLDVGGEDWAVVFSIGRYARAAVVLAEGLRQRGARILAVTDTGPSPLLEFADRTYRVRARGPGNFASVTAMVSLAQGLAIVLARQMGGERIEEAERLWEALETFSL